MRKYKGRCGGGVEVKGVGTGEENVEINDEAKSGGGGGGAKGSNQRLKKGGEIGAKMVGWEVGRWR